MKAMLLGALPVLALLALAGCAMFGPETVLKQQLHAVNGCPEDQMKVSSLGASRYKVEGCGAAETYVCGQQNEGWSCNK